MPNAVHSRTSFVTGPRPQRGAGVHTAARESIRRTSDAYSLSHRELPRSNLAAPSSGTRSYFNIFDLSQEPAVRAVLLGTIGATTLTGMGGVAYAQETIAPADLAAVSTATPTMSEVAHGAVLKHGDEGPAVAEMQTRLTNLGFPVAATGKFGDTTKHVLERFQTRFGVLATGSFGRTTLSVMEAAEQIATTDAGTSTAYVNGHSIGTIRLKAIDGKVVSADTATALRPMILAARRDGVDLEVVSGFRTNSEQRALYRAYLRGTGNLAAPAGYSEHQNGRALDLNTSDPGVYSWLKKNAGKYGFTRTVPSERWHWELTNPQ